MAHADAKSEAKLHIDSATALHKDGKFAEALDEMKTAYALDPQPELLYAIARLHVQLGQCDRALPFYDRFLDSKPKDSSVAKARQAIEMCKTNPPDAAQPAPPPAVVVSPRPPSVVPPPPPIARRETVTLPWYRDVVGDALLGIGVIASGVGLVSYVGARSDNASAAKATAYPDRLSLLDSARDQRNVALIAGGVGGALIVAGILKFTLGEPKTETRVVVVPHAHGGTLAWSRVF